MKTIVAIMLALATAALANSVFAVEWNNWNVAPYATSRDEACKKAPSAIDGFNMPAAVKEHFKKVLGTTCKGGTEVWLTPHQQLEQMWSGGQKPHVMNKVTVGELPVLKSPDDRPYRKGSVAETAKALSWTFAHEGKLYALYLPYVCFNWSWGFTPTVLVEKKCVELVFNAPVGGKSNWGIGTVKGRPLLPDACNAQKQGDGLWLSWSGKCPDCDPATGYLRKIIGGTAEVFQKFMYPVTQTKQTLRFSTEIWTDLVYICLEDANGKKSCGVYMRPEDWKGRYSVEIPDSMWLWDANCPK